SDVLAAVIMKDPEWSAVPTSTPASISRLLRRCLEKDSKRRLQAIGEARIAIEGAQSGDVGAGLAPALVETAQGRPQGSRLQPWRGALPWALVLLASAAFFITLGFLWRATRSSPAPPMELSFDIPSTHQLNTTAGPAALISPDGLRIAYASLTGQGKNQIYLRELDKPEATPLEGAEGTALFFSPDGQWIGFFGGAKLEKVSVFGGAPIALCSANRDRGASWGEDGTIVFTPDLTAPLDRIPAAGGTPEAVTHLDAGRKEITHRWPQVLPGGKDVLFTASPDNNNFEHAYVEAASLSTGQAKVLVENAYFGRYLPSGYLTYVSGGTLFAVPFDAKELKVTGTAMPIIQNIQADLTTGSAQFSFSRTGTVIYLTGQGLGSQVTLALLDRKGVASPLIKQPGDYFAPRFSPNGKQVAVQVGIGNVWVYDLARGTMTPLTFNPTNCTLPAWTPDGKRIACARQTALGAGYGISWLPSDGTGSLEPLTKGSTVVQAPSSWSPDGKTLAFDQFRAKTGSCCDIWTLAFDASGRPEEPKPFLGQDSTTALAYPVFSPDGHWLAYASDESGGPQVYVVPYPSPGGKRQISNASGVFPRWSRVGHELFFIQPGNPPALVSVPYSVQGNSFQPGMPTILFQGGFEMRVPFPSFDVAPDGKHFAVLEPVAVGGIPGTPAPPTVVVNWFTRVERLVAAGQK
ncbi:MAG TPA: hypothetical protein VG028_11155, partial [Terriglobia bacterium]|nr:hypothetical protein [Terriglobia bacterium]